MGYFKKVIFFLILFQGFANNLTASAIGCNNPNQPRLDKDCSCDKGKAT